MPGPKYVDNFKFDRSFGFSGSADASEGRVGVKSHTRSPKRYAGGGVAHAIRTAEGLAKVGRAAAREIGPRLRREPKPAPQRRVGLQEATLQKRERDAGLSHGGRAGYAKGGIAYSRDVNTGSALERRADPYNELDRESGGRTPLRPGFKKGGKAKKAMGGPVKAEKGGPTRQIAREEVMKHVNAPAPKGHSGGRKSSGKMRGSC